MAPKKKKTSNTKNVVRGFATTSVPKKVVPVVEEDITPAPPELTSEVNDLSQAGPSSDNLDIEQTHLQGLVDRLQEKTEKDIVRLALSLLQVAATLTKYRTVQVGYLLFPHYSS